MEDILKDVNAVVGVTGCFVCDDEGQVLASALPDLFDETILSTVGRTIAQTMAGLAIARRRKVGDMDLVYDQGRFIAKNLGEGCLCILCVRHINVPLLNLTANVAARKLAAMVKEKMKPVEAKPGAPLTVPDVLKVMSSLTDLLIEELGDQGFGRDNLLQVVKHRLRKLGVKYPFLEPVSIVDGRVDFSLLEAASVTPEEIAMAWSELIGEMYQSAVENLGLKAVNTRYRQVYNTIYHQNEALFENLNLERMLLQVGQS